MPTTAGDMTSNSTVVHGRMTSKRDVTTRVIHKGE